MPRASWKGFLRLSLVSCPVYLTPATTRTKSIRLHQVWAPRARSQEPAEPNEKDERPQTAGPTPLSQPDDADEEPEEVTGPATRISLRPVDRDSGETIKPGEVVKGYEFERGQYVTFTSAELKALDVESSHVIELAAFVPRDEVDPLYYNSGYYVYPDGEVATEAYHVIAAAMTRTGMAGLGRLTLSRRERMVLVEPRNAGMTLITLRSSEEVRPAQFRGREGEIDPEMIAIAEMILKRRAGHFEPATFRDRYQEALRELIDAKMRGLPVKSRAVAAPGPVVDLMAALKGSLERETGQQAKRSRRKGIADRRQRNLLLPVQGEAPRRREAEARRATNVTRGRKG